MAVPGGTLLDPATVLPGESLVVCRDGAGVPVDWVLQAGDLECQSGFWSHATLAEFTVPGWFQFSMTPEQGAEVGLAIAGVFVAAFAIRAIWKVIDQA